MRGADGSSVRAGGSRNPSGRTASARPGV